MSSNSNSSQRSTVLILYCIPKEPAALVKHTKLWLDPSPKVVAKYFKPAYCNVTCGVLVFLETFFSKPNVQ